MIVWGLDNGHGTREYTKGKLSPMWGDTPQIFEGEYNRRLVEEIEKQAIRLGINVQRITPENQDIPLETRVKRVNALASTFGKDNFYLISVHLNAGPQTQEKHQGWEVWTSVGQTKSDTIATHFFNVAKEEFPSTIPMRADYTDGDPDKESQFYILRKTICPAILTENLFMTSHQDCRYLNSPQGFDKIVSIHVKAMEELTFS